VEEALDQYKNLVPDHKIKEILGKTDIVELIGRYVTLNHAGTTIKGLCPFHSENTASFTINQSDQFYKCFGCGAGGDAIKFIQEIKSLDFRESLDFLEGRKVETERTASQKREKKKQAKKPDIKIIPLDRETALEKFSQKRVLELCHGVFNGFGDKALSEDDEKFRIFKDVAPWFPYYDENLLIDLMIVRFEDQHQEKEVLTFYWNGKNVAMKNYPVLIYGRCELSRVPELFVIIHEGEKCVNLASEKLFAFVHITWNGGGKKYPKPDWSILKNSPGVFLLPDDDKPGIETMHALHLLLKGDYGIDSIEIPSLEFKKARKIKKKGADIEEILQCYSPDEITKTILDLREKDETNTRGGSARKTIYGNMAEYERHGKIRGSRANYKNSNNIHSANSIIISSIHDDTILDLREKDELQHNPTVNNHNDIIDSQLGDTQKSQGDTQQTQGNTEYNFKILGIAEREKDENDTNRKNKSGISDDSSIHSDIQHTESSQDQDNDGHMGSDYPFKILGIADDGRAYFLDHTDRLISFETTQINANMLSDIGTYNYFKQHYFNYSDPTAKDWLPVIDEIRIQTKNKDFDMEKVRGRGAWKDSKGDICYHDGKTTTGKFDPDWTFLRKPKINVGLNSPHCSIEIRREIFNTAKTFNFTTNIDCIRLLSHAVLAPFGGALTWRPAIIVTGKSGSGKSTVVDFAAKPIAQPLIPWGGTTSEAAIRQHSANDSTPEYIDEMDGKRPKDKERIDDIFAGMRSSTSDMAPVTGKGSISGKVTVFRMRSMFCFVAVSDAIENDADDNRIIRVNFKLGDNKEIYFENLQKIRKLLSVENCNGIRSFTWDNLPKIIKLGERLELIIQIVTGENARFAAGESILLAAYIIVWEGFKEELSNLFLTEYVTDFYDSQTIEEPRDETEEMIVKILDHTTLVDILGGGKISMSYRELLSEMKRYLDQKLDNKEGRILLNAHETIGQGFYRDYKRIVEQAGVSVHGPTRELAIVQNHEEIKKILSLGAGYHRQLERHKNVVLKKESTSIDGTTKRCTIISGFLDFKGDE